MGSNTVKLIIAEAHVAIGLAAVGTLAATGHMDSTTAAGFIGGLLGIGVTPPLVAYSPGGSSDAPKSAEVTATATPAASGGPQGPTGTATAAETPGEITGTATASAMPVGP